jgi:hypothetical protein
MAQSNLNLAAFAACTGRAAPAWGLFSLMGRGL